MAVAIERSEAMVRLVYVLCEYARIAPNGNTLPPSEFGEATWREVYEQFYEQLGQGRPFKTFLGSCEGLRKGNFKERKETGIDFLPKYERILRSWVNLSREGQWADLQQYREV